MVSSPSAELDFDPTTTTATFCTKHTLTPSLPVELFLSQHPTNPRSLISRLTMQSNMPTMPSTTSEELFAQQVLGPNNATSEQTFHHVLTSAGGRPGVLPPSSQVLSVAWSAIPNNNYLPLSWGITERDTVVIPELPDVRTAGGSSSISSFSLSPATSTSASPGASTPARSTQANGGYSFPSDEFFARVRELNDKMKLQERAAVLDAAAEDILTRLRTPDTPALTELAEALIARGVMGTERAATTADLAQTLSTRLAQCFNGRFVAPFRDALRAAAIRHVHYHWEPKGAWTLVAASKDFATVADRGLTIVQMIGFLFVRGIASADDVHDALGVLLDAKVGHGEHHPRAVHALIMSCDDTFCEEPNRLQVEAFLAALRAKAAQPAWAGEHAASYIQAISAKIDNWFLVQATKRGLATPKSGLASPRTDPGSSPLRGDAQTFVPRTHPHGTPTNTGERACQN
ncbi:hypothetical protein FA95DRAFT_1556800 [Auriscalpium vulgare]|uniref:Uncharacterized protein n=1 Tax=Auriscalpium vulgare TaxID=40419 RepID=A0ACB8S075_9AGAM|nr:hypothetical protein FA95DRAFT_1556800 [Auriscalpium vulgare]